MQRRILRRQRGESLLEIIIAVAILATIMTSVFALLIRGSATNVNVTNRVVAINIASEGIEAVRNIRDTNWLKYSGDRRGKWLCYDTVAVPNACETDATSLISAGTYLVEFNEANSRYYLENQATSPSMTDKKTLPSEDFRLYLQNTTGRFTHTVAGDEETTRYYRQIYLSPESDWVSASCTSDGCPRNERLLVSVRVQWLEDDAVRHLDMETYLYDFFGRDKY